MKRYLLLLIAVLLMGINSLTSCAKINKDQPCGTYQNGATVEQLYKDGNGNCYYIDRNNGNHISVATCGC